MKTSNTTTQHSNQNPLTCVGSPLVGSRTFPPPTFATTGLVRRSSTWGVSFHLAIFESEVWHLCIYRSDGWSLDRNFLRMGNFSTSNKTKSGKGVKLADRCGRLLDQCKDDGAGGWEGIDVFFGFLPGVSLVVGPWLCFFVDEWLTDPRKYRCKWNLVT